jgi:hypothetical protein
MMAVSEVPVVVAGDGALSAAIGLGAPFAMTFVGHNRSAILGVGERLRGAAKTPAQLELIEQLFGTSAVAGAPDLAAAQALLRPENRALFAALAGEVGSLTDRVIETASAVRSKSGVELVR